MHNGIKIQKHFDVTWIYVEKPSKETLTQLEEKYHLHPVHLHESIQKVQHNQVEREENYLFMVQHVPTYDTQTNKIAVNQIGIFLGRDFVLTIGQGQYWVLDNLFEHCKKNEHTAEVNFKQGAAFLLHSLTSTILSNISDMTDYVVSQLDDIEDIVFDSNASDAQRIGQVRQKIVKLRRVIGPKRILLKDLDEQIDSFTGQNMSKYFSSNTKAVNGLWEIIEEAKDTIEIFKDADFTTSTEQTNRILAVLTLLFTLTIPITVVGTLYGMNVPLPGGLAVGPWVFLGHYTTLIVMLALSIVLAISMFIYFRKRKWF